MNTQGKMEEADKLMKKAMKLCNPSIVAFRIKPDWEAACPMFERAALCYKVDPYNPNNVFVAAA